MNEILNFTNISNLDEFWQFAKTVLVFIFVIYIIAYAVLQVRQVGILQQKVSTNVDSVVRVFTYVYLAVIIIVSLFVLSLVIL